MVMSLYYVELDAARLLQVMVNELHRFENCGWRQIGGCGDCSPRGGFQTRFVNGVKGQLLRMMEIISVDVDCQDVRSTDKES